MNEQSAEGWEAVFRGACLEAEMVHGLLEANGLRPVTQQLSSPGVWSGSVFEDCRVYVPANQLEEARALLAAEHDPGDA